MPKKTLSKRIKKRIKELGATYRKKKGTEHNAYSVSAGKSGGKRSRVAPEPSKAKKMSLKEYMDKRDKDDPHDPNGPKGWRTAMRRAARS